VTIALISIDEVSFSHTKRIRAASGECEIHLECNLLAKFSLEYLDDAEGGRRSQEERE
jgi:hypothetical protein